jgi:hypothetical protein
MSKSFFLCLAVAGVLTSAKAQARGGGDEVGNGGNALLCLQPDGKTTTRFFDYYEASVLNPGIKPDLGASGLSVMEKVDVVLQRMKTVSPQRAAKYRQFILSIFTDDHFVNDELVQVDDSNNPIMPANCRLQQLALHLNPKFDLYKKTVLFDKNLFEKLSNDDKAGILLHEAVYNELILLGKTGDSSGVRFLTAVFSSSAPLTLKTLLPLYVQVGFEQFEYGGLWLEIYGQRSDAWPVEFYADSGALKSGHTRAESYDFIENRLVGADQSLAFQNHTAVKFDSLWGQVEFRQDGTLKTISAPGATATIQKKEFLFLSAEVDSLGNLAQVCLFKEDSGPWSLRSTQKTAISIKARGKYLVKLDGQGLVSQWKATPYCDHEGEL